MKVLLAWIALASVGSVLCQTTEKVAKPSAGVGKSSEMKSSLGIKKASHRAEKLTTEKQTKLGSSKKLGVNEKKPKRLSLEQKKKIELKAVESLKKNASMIIAQLPEALTNATNILEKQSLSRAEQRAALRKLRAKNPKVYQALRMIFGLFIPRPRLFNSRRPYNRGVMNKRLTARRAYTQKVGTRRTFGSDNSSMKRSSSSSKKNGKPRPQLSSKGKVAPSKASGTLPQQADKLNPAEKA
ncbi:hypothetical protein OESDEN_08400 [Oesophagostomum dentatum]|uniref:SXP/RAL-2 family protein Ani s 5-like cation-binding domain-containing protein n=1 Tax=Oesophagostomum dentatum TaxID=61180 RepID=A0A0B1T2G5_OESDE|nr:hypothetical protein OESDEN_08400 [Oesophagostomum dentatum]